MSTKDSWVQGMTAHVATMRNAKLAWANSQWKDEKLRIAFNEAEGEVYNFVGLGACPNPASCVLPEYAKCAA